MKRQTTFYIVRHGESEHNVKKQLGTVPDAHLTVKGRKQAKDIKEKLKNINFDFIITSDLIRARQTAEIICEGKNTTINTAPSLRERSYGSLNGKTEGELKIELKDQYYNYLKMSDKHKFTYKLVPDMESVKDTLFRVLKVLQKLAKTHPEKTILVVSHNTVMRGLLIHLRYADHHEIDRNCIGNASYIKISVSGLDFVLEETFGISKK